MTPAKTRNTNRVFRSRDSCELFIPEATNDKHSHRHRWPNPPAAQSCPGSYRCGGRMSRRRAVFAWRGWTRPRRSRGGVSHSLISHPYVALTRFETLK
jgi:hypothetical protein